MLIFTDHPSRPKVYGLYTREYVDIYGQPLSYYGIPPKMSNGTNDNVLEDKNNPPNDLNFIIKQVISYLGGTKCYCSWGNPRMGC